MKSPMLTLESILVLDAIESRGSFASAAEQLNKVPSALSYIVQKLEEQLSVTIFVRKGRRSVLTPAGKHLLDEGRKVLSAVSKITEQTQTLAHGWEPKIRIAYDSVIEIEPVFYVLERFLLEHPNIEIELCEHVMHGSWEALFEDKVDLLIGGAGPIPAQAGIRSEKILELDSQLIASSNHEINHIYKPVTHDDIAGYRTVVVHDSSENYVPWSTNFISQSRHFYVSTVAQKIKAIEAGIGVGFLPTERVSQQLQKGSLTVVETDNKLPVVELFLSWKTVNKGKGLMRLKTLLLEQYE
ncbi:LysR substrate-binding domain-containing protein [Thalassotalea atypica]|uniref:LysR substrate-binding domain-containing protein n=1 Tax=Thalassotalea atypica TaxID=2054316 RepID=UPI002573D3E5|nr:LysR substrate-binding domain-containing protein [Thalassotalea atypica]